jgi:hypothetical protein
MDTVAIFLQNIGRSTAERVDIIFNYKPNNFDILPPSSTFHTNPDRRFIIILDRLHPREFLSIRLLEVRLVRETIYIGGFSFKWCRKNSADGATTAYWTKANIAVQILFYMGGFASVYIVISVLKVILK